MPGRPRRLPDWQPAQHSDDRVGSDDRVMETLDRLLTTQQLAGYLGVPVATLYAWRHQGAGPPGFRVGKHVRYRSSDIEQWIAQRLETPTRQSR